MFSQPLTVKYANPDGKINVDKGLEDRKRSVRLEKGCEGGMRGDKKEKWKWESKGTKGPTEIMTGRWEKQGGGTNQKEVYVKNSCRNNCYL